MRSILTCLLLVASIAVVSEEAIVEPSTGESFGPTLEVAGKSLACTGATVRKVYGFDIYAIAHYGDSAGAPGETATGEERLTHWMNTSSAKAMAIRFVFHADESNMRQFASQSLEESGLPEEKSKPFLDAFARDYEPGNEARLIATGGSLSIEINGKAEGTWDDPELVAALWKCWLGENSPVKDRVALVKQSKDKAPE